MPSIQTVEVGLTEPKQRLLRRRQAIELNIGHMKADRRINRGYLTGKKGDAVHAVLYAVCHNVRWLLRMVRKKGISFFSLLQTMGLATCLRVTQ